MAKSKIEWTDEVWNPVAGCSKVSAGCKHCYAERMAKRCVGMGVEKYQGTVDGAGRWTGRINFDEAALVAPLRWKRPRMVFVNSMSDLFHEGVPFEFVDRVFAVMALCPQHTFQVLTKRPERMLQYMNSPFRVGDDIHDAIENLHIELMEEHEFWSADHDVPAWPLPNVWLGVSVEDQEQADARIPKLLACPAALRFLSCEPLLGAVDLMHLQPSDPPTEIDCLSGTHGVLRPHGGVCNSIDWVICGGESGAGVRPMHPDWACGLRDQCVGAGVPFFFKQWGEWAPWYELGDIFNPQQHRNSGSMTFFGENGEGDVQMLRVGKKAAGRWMGGREWNEMPGCVALSGLVE